MPVINRVTVESMVVEAAAAARPPERLTVSEAAEKYRFLNNQGAYVGPMNMDLTPYLREPQDVLQSMDFTGMVFAGPAQSAKTEMFLNWLAYSAKCDPADMMLVQTSITTARDFSARRVDRMHRHSPEIGKLMPVGHGDNVMDKHYLSGMLLSLSWPAINELSGKPIPRCWVTDLDRMDEDIGGEGSVFDLTRARNTTFRRHGMTGAESSPGFNIDNPKWQRKTPHEAPPTKGILSLYNRGDRRRLYWKCVFCHNAFEPDFNLLEWPDSEDKMEAAEAAVLKCPHCQEIYHHQPHDGVPGKYEMNLNSRWIKDGMIWTREGEIVGKPFRSDIASFWMKGVAAAFSDWKKLVLNYLTAEEEYEKTGSEESLKTTINVDQGNPYLPKLMANERVPEEIKGRARDLGMHMVPPGVRFLIATVDTQKNRFVVQVHGIMLNGDIAVVDRFEIKKSNRLDDEGERLWVNPGAYKEDWRLLVKQVMLKSYELSDGTGRRMKIKFTMADSGGKDGVTANAYQFVRWLRNPKEDDEGNETEDLGDSAELEYGWEPGLPARFMLLKGGSTNAGPRVQITYPDSQRKDRMAGARGEIMVALLNTSALKDMVDNRLDRAEAGGRFIFPKWLPDTFYAELTVEVKDPKKGWINPKNYRNESFDLLAYCLAALLTPMIGFERWTADRIPTWAADWDENDLIYDPAFGRHSAQTKKNRAGKSLADLAKDLA